MDIKDSLPDWTMALKQESLLLGMIWYWAPNQERRIAKNESAKYSYFKKRQVREGDSQNDQLGKGAHLMLGKVIPKMTR